MCPSHEMSLSNLDLSCLISCHKMKRHSLWTISRTIRIINRTCNINHWLISFHNRLYKRNRTTSRIYTNVDWSIKNMQRIRFIWILKIKSERNWKNVPSNRESTTPSTPFYEMLNFIHFLYNLSSFVMLIISLIHNFY